MVLQLMVIGQVVPESELNRSLKSSLEGAYHTTDADEGDDSIDDENLDLDDGVQTPGLYDYVCKFYFRQWPREFHPRALKGEKT